MTRDPDQKPATHCEELEEKCPKCQKKLWANVQYHHKTVKAWCDHCDFEGRVPNPNFQYDKKVAEVQRITDCLVNKELMEAVEAVFGNDKLRAEHAMYLLRHTEAHEPEGFKRNFEKFKSDVDLLVKVVQHYQVGVFPVGTDAFTGECHESYQY